MVGFFKGTGERAKEEISLRAAAIPEKAFEVMRDPAGYRASPDAIRAVNVALALKIPLLIGGEPGSGKTLLGGAVAYELDKAGPLIFVVKSTSQARDLFYTFDAVRYFQAKPREAQENPEPKDFIEYQALGLAILLALPLKERKRFLPEHIFEAKPDDNEADDDGEAEDEITRLRAMLRHSRQRQCVVVVDEIDKAPRDLPNDILDELDSMRFRVPELGGIETPQVPYEHRPIVFFTTNSERQLPDAFLRRCAFLYIDYPKRDELEAIAASRLKGLFEARAPLLSDVVAFYERLRKEGRLNKAPGTAELLQFLQAALVHGADPRKSIAEQREALLRGVQVLAKMNHDVEPIQTALKKWNGGPPRA